MNTYLNKRSSQVTGNDSETFVFGCMKVCLNVTIYNVILTFHIRLFKRSLLETLYKRFAYVLFTAKEQLQKEGAQWLSGRVLDWRPKGRGFEPHRRHCVVVLEQDTFILA